MVEIEKPRIECIEKPGDNSYGKCIVEPLERGYGTTLGNSLRRILLSSLPGTAVTSIKIAGVQHEFSSIPGVKEDVTEIVLNVKGIDPLDVRHSFNHLRHLFRLSSEYRTGDDIELHVAVVCRGLHSDDFPAPSRSSELGADGDGAFRFYRRRDHARTNHRTA